MKGRPIAPTPEADGDNKVATLNHPENDVVPPEASMVSTKGIYYHRSVDSKYGWQRLDLITITSSNNFDPQQGRGKV